MKIRLLPAILVFVSAYSPLSVIFLIQDIDTAEKKLSHPVLIFTILGIAVLSCLLVTLMFRWVKSSNPPVEVLKVTNRSGELINYSIPYMITFFVMDLSDIKILLSFLFFMVIMFFLTLKTHNIFVNPILALLGYNIYSVQYRVDDRESEYFFLVKGERLHKGETCRIVEISEHLYLVTDRNPEV